MKSWDPFRDLLTIQDRMNKLFESVLTGPVAPGSDGEGVGYWRPQADVIDSGGLIEIECELPGLTRKDLDILVDGNVLTVRGERVRNDDSASWTFQRLERPHGTFLRRFELPDDTELSQLQVELEEGVLSLRVPRSAPHRAAVAASSVDN